MLRIALPKCSRTKLGSWLWPLLLMLVLLAPAALAQGTGFTYQGRLTDGGGPATGAYDLQFRLFDALVSGNQVGSTLVRDDVPVTGGIFSVSLDFGAAVFSGANRFLEIAVRPGASTGAFTALSPLQPITATPYALQSLNATNAANAANAMNATTAQDALQLGGVAANQFVLTGDARLTDARNPLPNSANYIQNTTAPQAGSNFNIGGNGTAGGTLSGNIVNTTTQYNLGGLPVLIAPGSSNLFVGVGTGASNTIGSSNSFFGTNAGNNNSTGSGNSFFGGSAGLHNTTGQRNSFFGSTAGFGNLGAGSTGSDNSFFGNAAGLANSTGLNNSFFGSLAGQNNQTGSRNAFFGYSAGIANTAGEDNAFFGNQAGQATGVGGTGSLNAFFGSRAGLSNTIGYSNSSFGFEAGRANTDGCCNTFLGRSAGFENTTGSANTYAGAYSGGSSSQTGDGNTYIGYAASASADNLRNATAIGQNSVVSTSNSLVLGHLYDGGVNVGIGTSAPLAKLDVRGDVFVGLTAVPDDPPLGGNNLYIANDGGDPNNSFRLDGFVNRLYISARSGAGSAAGTGIIFRTGPASGGDPDRVVIDQNGNMSVTGCISAANISCASDARLKQNVTPLSYGLREVLWLRPVRWQWKDTTNVQPILGLIAQEVEPVMPELVLRGTDDKEPLGLNYMGLIPVLVKGTQEQQTQIE